MAEKKKRGRKPGPVALRDCHLYIPEPLIQVVEAIAVRESRSVSKMVSIILARDTEVTNGR